MGLLDHYDPLDRKRITNLAASLVISRVDKGEIPCTDEAISAAMPQAVKDATQTINAVNEYLAG
jgi:hypothetical protein